VQNLVEVRLKISGSRIKFGMTKRKLNMLENQLKQSIFKRSLPVYLAVVLVIIAFTAGLLLNNKNEIATGQNEPVKFGQITGDKITVPEYLKKDVNFSLFWDVWQIVQDNYIDRPVGESKLLYGAMAGIVNVLDDPYSIFLEPQESKKFSDDLKGKFDGIGAEIGLRDQLITIVAPLPESPAFKAGLKAGDKVIEIDSVSTENMNLDEAVSRIRGKKGTTVKLKIFRPSDNKYKEISIVRDVIKIVSVNWEMKDNNIAYLRITNFNEDTDQRFKSVVKEILLKNPKGLILDLRNNPGGYLDRAVEIASYWLEPGQVVVQEEFTGGEKKPYLANGQAQFKNLKTLILVNGGSASASEIVAGALQDFGLAQLVGEKTFGKGSVQSLEELQDGSSVKITVARWLTPKNRQINVIGIEPDIKIELTEEDFNQGKDPQLEKVIEMMIK